MEGLQESNLLTPVVQYVQEARERDKYVAGLINLYVKEIKKLNEIKLDVLTDEEKKLVQEEINFLSSHGDESFRSGDIASRHDLITGDLINDFVSKIQEHCPLINSILGSLIGSTRPERNILKTNAFKFKCASHSLAALLNIRSSRTSTDHQELQLQPSLLPLHAHFRSKRVRDIWKRGRDPAVNLETLRRKHQTSMLKTMYPIISLTGVKK